MSIDIDGLSFEELLELNQRVVARLKMLESMQAHIEMMAFNIGQRVSFEHGGGRLMGTLVKYNRKTVTVVTDNGQRWNIPPHLLAPVKDAGTAEPQQPPTGKKKKRLR
ncbi:hypothetical protein [Thiolapillus brandeum]|uniref:Uncharacterized protein n=1 Tax=Thiolapillus brandeum TaxID=1076588 RepID=A0A7U6GHI3_9GAMM|nr:hypothetical protein [Thiolapillus brandeum]BAO43693.1 conserved hypothetical protein [Thiolapillus brandeum]BAO44916.1 conserved hypothetical protein [Thiolapillus brandeum]